MKMLFGATTYKSLAQRVLRQAGGAGAELKLKGHTTPDKRVLRLHHIRPLGPDDRPVDVLVLSTSKSDADARRDWHQHHALPLAQAPEETLKSVEALREDIHRMVMAGKTSPLGQHPGEMAITKSPLRFIEGKLLLGEDYEEALASAPYAEAFIRSACQHTPDTHGLYGPKAQVFFNLPAPDVPDGRMLTLSFGFPRKPGAETVSINAIRIEKAAHAHAADRLFSHSEEIPLYALEGTLRSTISVGLDIAKALHKAQSIPLEAVLPLPD